jgi:asparagine synthase (glutamine-hydrolysing)
MCGLAGLLSDLGDSKQAIDHIAQDMGRVLAHRGPDGCGVWSDADAGVAFAHRRLAIIDLTDRGHQPMISRDGRLVLVFNGEIYNYRQLRARLIGSGAPLRGRSDTEVLLETIARSSLVEALEQANGMFAFALWDRQERELTLVRDRLGEKPLYYTATRHEFLFASELSALHAHPRFDPTISPGALALFVRHSYVPGPHTIYDHVFKLPPGHMLTVRLGAWADARPRPFWSLNDVVQRGVPGNFQTNPAALIDETEALLQDSVRMRMVSDVPIGAFLSGGIDSSLVVSMMQRASTQPVRTFTVSVGGTFDEATRSAAVAHHLGTEHTEIDLAESEALELVTRLPEIYDEPFGDPSAIPTALMSAAARRHVTVCLSGDGGDELMAGYNRYKAAGPGMRRLMRTPKPLRVAAAKALVAVPPSRWEQLGAGLPPRMRVPDLGTKLHKLARLMPADDAYSTYRALVTNVEPDGILIDASEPRTAADDHSGWLAGLDDLQLMQYFDTVMVLPDDMLVKVDRATMASSLECRVPLLDHRFVELAWSLPSEVKVRGGRGKWLLRQILTRHMPATLFERPKQGFDPPLAQWLRGPLQPLLRDLLAPTRLRRQGLFDASAVHRLVQEHESGRRNHDYALWTLMTFQGWIDHWAGGR